MAVAVGVFTGVLVSILYVWIMGRIARRRHPDAIHVAVNGAPILLAVIIGFVVGFVWMMRR